MRIFIILISILAATDSFADGFFSRYSIFSKAAPAAKATINFGEVVEKNIDGLDADPQRATLILFAQELPVAKNRGQVLAGLTKVCAQPEYHELCKKIEVDTASKRNASVKKGKVRIALDTKNLPELNKLDLQEATGLLGKTKPEKLVPFAQKVLEIGECQGTALYTAMGAHFEDKFPEPSFVDLTLALYEKSMSCGKDEPAARAAYRLGLLRVWKGQCPQAIKDLKGMATDKAWSSLNSRAEYWISVCSSTKERLPAATTKELVFEKFDLFPMSFHSIVFSLQQEDELFKTVKNHADPGVLFRSAKDSGKLNDIVAAVESVLRENKNEYARYWMEFTEPDKTILLEPEFRLYTGILYHKADLSLHKFKIFSQLFTEDSKFRSISTLKIMYPLWKFDIVQNATKTTDPLLVLSLIRQESAFQERAQSKVGARGMMQIMPKTARSLYGKNLRNEQLYDPELNVGLGTKYVDKLLQKYDGNVYKVLAAYNAGGLRVDEWSKRYPTNNDILFMDMIPYKETREYVASILRNYYWYSRLYPDLSIKQVAFWDQPSVKID